MPSHFARKSQPGFNLYEPLLHSRSNILNSDVSIQYHLRKVNVKFSNISQSRSISESKLSQNFKGPNFHSGCMLKLSKKHRLICHIIELYPVLVERAYESIIYAT